MFSGRWSTQSLFRGECIALMLGLCALVFGSSATAQQPTDAPLSEAVVEAASGSGDHLWLILRDPQPPGESSGPPAKEKSQPYRLCYQGPGMAPDAIAPLRRIAFLPDRFIAIGGRAYLISARKAPATGLDVFSLTVMHNDTFDVYYAEPADRMELHEPLPGCELLDVLDMGGSLVALVKPIGAGANEQDSDDWLAESAMLVLRGGRWESLALPETYDPDQPAMLGAPWSTSCDQLLLLQPQAGAGNPVTVYRRSTDGSWSAEAIPVQFDSIHDLVPAGGQLAVIREQDDGGSIAIDYLRVSGLIKLVALPAPEQPWFLVGGSRLRIITAGDAGPEIIAIDSITGDQADAQQLRRHPTRAGSFWFAALFLAGAISVALLIVLIRPAQKEAIQLPDKTELLPPMQRLIALVIDVFPPAVATLLVTGCSIAELLQAPLLPPHLIMSNEYLIMIGLTLVHSTITEMVTGTTLGKAMVGARVINIAGDRPAIGPCLLRAFGKALTLLVLPIAFIGVLNRNQQGVDDLLGRTLVVHEPDEPGEPSDDDR